MSGSQTPELDLSDKLAALDARALDMLGVLALANGWQSESSWIKLASASGVRAPGGKQLHRSQVRSFIDRFIEWKLVSVGLAGSSHRYRVPQPVTLAVLQRLHDSERLAELDGRASPGWGARGYGPGSWSSPEALETDLRIAALERNPDAIARVVAAAERCLHRTDFGMWLVLSLGPNTPLTVLDCLADKYSIAADASSPTVNAPKRSLSLPPPWITSARSASDHDRFRCSVRMSDRVSSSCSSESWPVPTFGHRPEVGGRLDQLMDFAHMPKAQEVDDDSSSAGGSECRTMRIALRPCSCAVLIGIPRSAAYCRMVPPASW